MIKRSKKDSVADIQRRISMNQRSQISHKQKVVDLKEVGQKLKKDLTDFKRRDTGDIKSKIKVKK